MGIKSYLTDRRILLVVFIVVGLLVLDIFFGGPHFLHFGIEFIGGTQIPITLEHSVSATEMSNLTNILQQRVSTFGLKQVSVEGVGTSEIYVTIPTVSGSEINNTISIIESQGVFQGVVNGKEALNGSSILTGSIGSVPPAVSGTNVSWAVDFYLTQSGANRFSKVAYGQTYQPLYMFLDRPTNAIVLLNSSLLSSAQAGVSQTGAISALQSAVSLGSETIPIEMLNNNGSNWNSVYPFFVTHNLTYSKVIVEKNVPSFITNALKSLNYTLVLVSAQNLTPTFSVAQAPQGGTTTVVETWPAVGLLSSPTLQPGVTNGSTGLSYQITGAAPVNLSLQNKVTYATNQGKTISSILSGGALPVKVIVGTPTTIPATLGTEFLYVSGLAAVLAVLAVAFVIVARYKKLFLIMPIILTVLAELFIIVSVIGLLGTIDLAAVAGMIAVVGTGVDAQIIITDEVLTNTSESAMKSKLNAAFYIVWVDAALVIIAMLPLLFSTSLVSIIGFSESTILGALLGVLITRPAYGAIVSKHYIKEA